VQDLTELEATRWQQPHSAERCICTEIALARLIPELFGDSEQIKTGRKQEGQEKKIVVINKEIR